MRELDQFKLHAMFADPSDLYEQLVNRRGYTPKQVVEFDAELIMPGWSAMEHALLCVMIHRERKAYVIMLNSDDLTLMRDSLEQARIAVNSAGLLKAGHPNQVFGFGL
jgi:hypothetical protein